MTKEKRGHALIRSNGDTAASGGRRPIVGTDPDLIEMQDGTLVMSFGHKPDYREHGNYLAFSTDHGASWGT